MDGLKFCSWAMLITVGFRTSHGYSLPHGVKLHGGEEFDYIVVGAGAAGATAAARLALAEHDVLLVEAGSDPYFISRIPGIAQGLQGSPLDWQYVTESNNKSCLSYRGKQCRYSRGRCLGGSTSVNYMMYTRGSPRDFDDLNIPGWTWDDIKPYFLRFEGLRDLDRLPPSSNPYHNTTGPIRIEYFADSKNPWHDRLVEGYKLLNIPYNPDVCAESQIGVTQVMGYVYNNKRMSTARGYLARSDVKKRLKIAKLTRCTGVILDDNNEARGITVVHGLSQTKLWLQAREEVILSAGAIGTPQILMLSGIGHAEHLQKFNIPVRLNLPVGDEMTDHVLPLAFVKVDRRAGVTQDLLDVGNAALQFSDLLQKWQGPLTSIGLTDITTFINSNCYDFERRQLENYSEDCALPTLQFIHSYIERRLITLAGPLFQQATDLVDAVVKQLQKINEDHSLLVFSPVLLQPHSVGTVRLASTDPLAAPAIFPNFLSDDRDCEAMVRALRIVEQLMESEPLSGAELVRLQLDGCPGVDAGAEYWSCYARHMTHSSYHAVGTAGVGRVLDARLRVLGAGRLRVADLAAMPRLVRANTAATAIAIGERVADYILNGR